MPESIAGEHEAAEQQIANIVAAQPETVQQTDQEVPPTGVEVGQQAPANETEAAQKVYTFESSNGHTYSGTPTQIGELCPAARGLSLRQVTRMAELIARGQDIRLKDTSKLPKKDISNDAKKALATDKTSEADVLPKSSEQSTEPVYVSVPRLLPEAVSVERPRFITPEIIDSAPKHVVVSPLEHITAVARRAAHEEAVLVVTSLPEQQAVAEVLEVDPRPLTKPLQAEKLSRATIYDRVEEKTDVTPIIRKAIQGNANKGFVKTELSEETLEIAATPDSPLVIATELQSDLWYPLSVETDQAVIEATSTPATAFEVISEMTPDANGALEEWINELDVTFHSYDIPLVDQDLTTSEGLGDRLLPELSLPAPEVEAYDLSMLGIDAEADQTTFSNENKITPMVLIERMFSDELKDALAETLQTAQLEVFVRAEVILEELAQDTERLRDLFVENEVLSNEATAILKVLAKVYEQLLIELKQPYSEHSIEQFIIRLQHQILRDTQGTHEKKNPTFNVWPALSQFSRTARSTVVGKVALMRFDAQMRLAA